MSHPPIELLRRFVVTRRKHLEMNQQLLHEASGLSTGWIGSLEAGRLTAKIKPQSLQRLATGLVLADETPGTLCNFLYLVLSNALTDEVIQDVAQGQKRCAVAMQEATRGHGVPDRFSTCFKDKKGEERAERNRRKNRALDILRFDLTQRDYGIVEAVIGQVYLSLDT